MPKLILASSSPRRSELLASLGLEFSIVPSTVPEPAYNGETPADYGQKLATVKATSVAQKVSDGLVIGADTIVVLDGRILGKPQDSAEAREMLTRLSGRTHSVYTGIAVVNAKTKELVAEAVETQVAFRPLSKEEIEAYVDSGEPLDKAGAYGIQRLGGLLVSRINGCYFNVVGLPLSALDRLLKRFDYAILLQRRDNH